MRPYFHAVGYNVDMAYQNYRDLRIWQRAKNLSVEIYGFTKTGEISRDFGLRDQIRKSAISIVYDLAEGYVRGSNREFLRFLYISMGSTAELSTQLEIAKDIGYLERQDYELLEDRCNQIGAMINKLIQKRKPPGVPNNRPLREI